MNFRKERCFIDIAKMSILMSQQQLKSDVSIQLMAKTMEMAEVSSESMTDMLETAAVPHPDLGQMIDIKV